MAANEDRLRQMLTGRQQTSADRAVQPQRTQQTTNQLSEGQRSSEDVEKVQRLRKALTRADIGQDETGLDMGPISGFLQGTNVTLANIIGAPVDLINSALDIAGFPVAEQPFGGSENIREMMNRFRITTAADFKDLPADAQIGFRAGEVVGGSIPFMAAPFVASSAGLRGGQILNRLHKAPGTFAATEAAAVTGSAQGAAIAQAAAPERPGIRFGAEVVGGVANPLLVAARLTGPAGRALKTSLRSFTKMGKEKNAAEILQDIVESTGEDPTQLARTLEAAEETGLTLTSAQKTGSKALIALEENLAQRSSKFSGNRKQLFEDANTNLRSFIDDLVATGDPTALVTASKLRQRHFNRILEERIRQAEQRAAEAMGRVGTPSGLNRSNASKAAQQSLRGALKEARAVERSLYDEIPKNVRTNASNLIAARSRLKSELLKGESLPFDQQMKGVTRSHTTSGKLIQLRKRLRAKARDATGKAEFDQARMLNELGDSVEQDIADLGLAKADEARQYSIILNDKFTRSFGGEAIRKRVEGDPRIAPEEVLERAFGRGGPKAERTFRQMEESAELGDEALEKLSRESAGQAIFSGAVRNSQEAFLRDISGQIMDNGRVNPDKLRSFMQRNDQLLSRFPDLRSELQDAESAQRLYQKIERSNRSANDAIMKKAAFARLVDVEDPERAVGSIIDGDAPRREFGQLARLAQKSGKGAVEGLKTSALDHARNRARVRQSGFSFRRFKQELTEPKGERRPAMMTLLKEKNVIGKDEAKRLERLVSRAVEIEDVMLDPSRADEIIGEPDPIFDFATRIVGANIGAQGAGSSTGAPMVAAHAGSRFLRRQLEKLPATKTLDVLTEAAEEPKFAAALLRKPASAAQRKELDGQINAFLLQAGFVPDAESDE